ncbi:DNA gyrase inhibitor YacG [Brevundimonas sp.]|uniref:DNA gyrase inhibitor YacG n=1 Tax=Brevundimonas sp. TaxID=1871086 RepID=UPI0035674813
MATCPTCRRQPADSKYKPFCSKRCADVDLQRWFTGGYVIADSVDEASTDPSPED